MRTPVIFFTFEKRLTLDQKGGFPFSEKCRAIDSLRSLSFELQ